MGTRCLHSDISNPRRKRSFTVPSFRKTAGEQQSVDASASAAEETARIRKAAAWQWYTRGVGEMVVPTRRPLPSGTLARGAAAAVGGLAQPKGGEESSIGKKPAAPESPPAVDTRRAASRFKVEASCAARGPPGGAPPTTIPADPSPLLYDEVELSGLKTQMEDFVQRLQKKQSRQKAAKPLNSGRAPAAPAADHSSTQHPPASGEGSGFLRPISALLNFVRKVMSRSSSKDNTAALQDPEAPSDDEPEPDEVQYHYHHYIHHHHHHYHHGGPSPNRAEFIRLRRYSESSGIRPLPSLIREENEVAPDEEDEESPISSFLGRRRRHSDVGLAKHNSRKNSDYGGVEMPEKEPAEGEELKPPRGNNSERSTSSWNRVPKLEKSVEAEEQQYGQSAVINSRRRHSMESFGEGGAANMRWKTEPEMEEEKARRGAGGGGSGVYKLGGAGAYECKLVVRRRHSMYDGSIGQDIEQRDEGLRGWPRLRQAPAQPAAPRQRQPHS